MQPWLDMSRQIMHPFRQGEVGPLDMLAYLPSHLRISNFRARPFMALEEDFLSPGGWPYTHSIQLPPHQQGLFFQKLKKVVKSYNSQILHKEVNA